MRREYQYKTLGNLCHNGSSAMAPNAYEVASTRAASMLQDLLAQDK